MFAFVVIFVSSVELISPLSQYTDAKTILREQFGWPDNFDKEKWHRQRGAITERLLYPDDA
jgi:hypothetical protein